MSVFTYTGTLTIVECARCHTNFGVPRGLIDDRQADHASFYCPQGHRNYYPGESNEEALARRLRSAEARLVNERDQREATERSLIATKGHLTRVKKRAAHGVCPFGCNRHFANLEAHVKSKHPNAVEVAERGRSLLGEGADQ